MSAAGTHASTALKAMRKIGREATQDSMSRVAFFEWAVPETVGGVPVGKLSAEELVPLIMAHHPRAGFGLRTDYVAGQLRRDLPAALRAYGGLDSDTSEESMPIDESAFRRAMDRTRRIPSTAPVAFGLASDGELRQAAISVAWNDPADGVTLTELIEERDQVRWSIDATLNLLGRWEGSAVAVRMDAGGRDLAEELRRGMRDRGIDESRLIGVSPSDYGAACHRFRSGIESETPTLLHLGERGLRRALQSAAIQSGKWTSVKGPVAVLDAHTLAAWGCTRLPEPPAPEPVFRVL